MYMCFKILILDFYRESRKNKIGIKKTVSALYDSLKDFYIVEKFELTKLVTLNHNSKFHFIYTYYL